MPDLTSRTFALQATAVAALAIFWALNWPMMKIGLTTVEPWTFRAVVVTAGGVGCFIVARIIGASIRVPKRERLPLLWVGLMQGLLWNAFSGFGTAMIEAGRAAVLAFTMPVWAVILAILFLGEAVTRRRLFGLALGMAGMGLLLLPALEALGSSAVGAMLMVGGAMSWAVATTVVKKANFSIHPMVLAGWQFAIGAGPLIAAAVILGRPSSILEVDGATASAIIYSALFPMIVCQAIFFTIVKRLPASLASMSTLMIPPLGVYFSAAILGERVGPAEFGALVLVSAAMVMILPGFNWRAIRRPREASRPG
ncbi:MAG: DMT family transporter [Pseudomonadota bacterium]